jgi:hypothetical protein
MAERDDDEGVDVYDTALGKALPYLGAAGGAVLGVMGGKRIARKMMDAKSRKLVSRGLQRDMSQEKAMADSIGGALGTGLGASSGFIVAGGNRRKK